MGTEQNTNMMHDIECTAAASKQQQHQQKTCGYRFELPIIKHEFNKRNFICLFAFNYV